MRRHAARTQQRCSLCRISSICALSCDWPLGLDRQVLAITFDEAGIVTNIERFGLEKGEIVAISRRVTTEPIKGRNVLAQIFGNIGRLDPSQLLAK